MAYSNGVITAPVSIRDVQKALGVASGDLMTLARSGQIRRLSPYKPIRGNQNGQTDTPGVLADVDIINRNLGFAIPEFPFTVSGTTWNFNAVIKGIVDDTVPWPTTPGPTDTDSRGSIGNGWIYGMPVVATHFARLTDFNGYSSSQPNGYVDTTFEVLAGTKNIYAGGSYTAKFFVRMSPLAPRNFRSLVGKYLGVAITSPSIESGAVYFYIGNGTDDFSSIATAAMGEAECSVIIPSTLFNIIVGKCSGQNDIVLNVVGFVAPSGYAGYQNIKSDYAGYIANPNAMNGLMPLPGLDADTIIWHPSSTLLCYLNIIGNGSIITPGTTQTTMVLKSVTNNYGYTDTFNMYASAVQYTYDIIDANNNVVYQQTQRSRFGNSSAVVDVTNPSAGTHRREDLTDYNIQQTLSLPNQSYSIDGYRVIVYLWYWSGVNPTSGTYQISSQFFIKIGTPSPFD